MTELPLVEVLSIPVATITSDPSKLRVLIRMRSRPSVEQRTPSCHSSCWIPQSGRSWRRIDERRAEAFSVA